LKELKGENKRLAEELFLIKNNKSDIEKLLYDKEGELHYQDHKLDAAYQEIQTLKSEIDNWEFTYKKSKEVLDEKDRL
jgi:mRNA-degrading endonuclease YafQ of YafQ-DinJ toxin-antitoxin module